MSSVHLEMVAVHFSTRCGAGCSFCYFSDPLKERHEPTPLATIERILRKVAAEGVRDVLFVGGDPIIHPEFLPSLEIAKQAGLIVSVLSNSWAIRPLEAFDRALSLIDNCEATILGSTAETHDTMTQRPGSFRQLMQNLQRIGAAGKAVGVCANATPQNRNDIYPIVRMVREQGIPVRSLMIQRIVPSGDAKGTVKFGLNLDDVQVLMEQIDRVALEFNIPVHFEDPVPWCTVDPKFHKYLARCEWGYTRGSINSQGRLNRCGADDHYRLGSIWDGNIQDIWRDHPILRSFRSKTYLPEECQTCDLLDKCGGGCPLSCGTMTDHSLDQLYLQRLERDSGITPSASAPSGRALSHVFVRFATEDDLPAIVELEETIFSTAAPVFSRSTIERYFHHCSQAFRVAYFDGQLVGYSAVFPMTLAGVDAVKKEQYSSVIYMHNNYAGTTFSSGVAGLYLEVIATRTDGPRAAKLALMRDLVRLLRRYSVPVYTCPVSGLGLELAENAGFYAVAPGSRLFMRPAPLVIM